MILDKNNRTNKKFPLVFEIDGKNKHEYVPREIKYSKQILDFRARMVFKITGNISYFLLRHQYEPMARKTQDIAFIWHYSNAHQDNTNASWLEQKRYIWYWMKYGYEIRWITDQVKSHKFDKIPKDVREYMERWHAFDNIEPFQLEFYHGMDSIIAIPKENNHF